MTYSCRECGDEVPRGQARIRTVLFEQIAWCDPCYRVLHPGDLLPTQRVASGEPAIPGQRRPSATERATARWRSRG